MTLVIVRSNSINSQSDFISYIKANSIGGRNLSISGLVKLCEVDDKVILNGANFNSPFLAEKLSMAGFDGVDFAVTGFSGQSACLVIEYFAYESKVKAEGAKRLARLFGTFGLQACFDAAHKPEPIASEIPVASSPTLAIEQAKTVAHCIDDIHNVLSKSNPRLAQILIDIGVNSFVEYHQPKLVASVELPEYRR